ncbi:MAG: peptidase M22, partial [Oscillospiraceae bacterium]|nr:peptidase M22 [Oscillospiraceae bacterium]
IMGIPVYETSHQTGHILAALYSAGVLAWKNHPFLAFHVSGGTTDCVRCTPDDAGQILQIKPVSSSLDLKAGQLIDRVGIMLGLQFPCGAELEKIAMQSKRTFFYKPVMKDLNCCMSGLENQCRKFYQAEHMPSCDVAMFCLTAIAEILKAMTDSAIRREQIFRVLYAGGVMSDKYLQEYLKNNIKNNMVYPGTKIETAFAEPAFSCDNAAGTAIYAAMQDPDFSC